MVISNNSLSLSVTSDLFTQAVPLILPARLMYLLNGKWFLCGPCEGGSRREVGKGLRVFVTQASYSNIDFSVTHGAFCDQEGLRQCNNQTYRAG